MSKALRLRTAVPEDAETVSAVLADSYGRLLAGDYPAEVLAATVPMMARANPRLLAGGTYFIAEDAAGWALGVGGWTAEPPSSRAGAPEDLAHVRHVATRAEAVRRGAGRMILQRCIAEAGAAGFRRIEALSTLTAATFYASLGFVDIEPCDAIFPNGVRLPSRRMERVLAAG